MDAHSNPFVIIQRRCVYSEVFCTQCSMRKGLGPCHSIEQARNEPRLMFRVYAGAFLVVVIRSL